MQRLAGAMKLHLWLFLRSKKLCEDDRCPELKRRWDETMARHLKDIAA